MNCATYSSTIYPVKKVQEVRSYQQPLADTN